MEKEKKRPEHILFFTKNWLGDILFELPAMKAVYQTWPQARIACLVHKRCVPVLQSVPYVSDILSYDEDGVHDGLFGKFRLIGELKRELFTKAFLFHRSLTRALIIFAARIPERIGYDTKGRGWLLTTRVPDQTDGTIHQVDYFLNLVRAAGAKGPFDPYYEYFFTNRDQLQADRFMSLNHLQPGQFVVFNPGANWDPKRWAARSFAALGELVFDRLRLPIVVTGHSRDLRLFERIRTRTAEHVPLIPSCGKTSVGELAALLAKARFVVSGDSGPIHFASGVGTPVVALFGPTNPAKTGPRGKGKVVLVAARFEDGMYGWEDPTDRRRLAMGEITPEQVFQAMGKEGLLS